MEKFLEKMQKELDEKIIATLNGKSIVKPFEKIYEEVRERPKKKIKKISQEESSIYSAVIAEFLKDNPELIRGEEK